MRERDELIHALAKIFYDYHAVKYIAVEGLRIVKVLNGKVRSVNNYYTN